MKKICVVLAAISALLIWQSATGKPPEKPGNPGMPGLLAEIAELNGQIEELEAILQEYEEFAPIPKTGQTICHDVDGSIIDCSGTGQDAEYQHGVPWPTPRFTDKDDGTVTDNLTGLMWLENAKCIATNYPGFDNDENPADGLVTWQHALDFVIGINDGTYPDCGAGFNDWRLPNVREMHSLIYYGTQIISPLVPNTAGTGQWSEDDPFTNLQPLGTTTPRTYWTSTAYTTVRYAIYVDTVGRVGNHYMTQFYLVWPVRNRR